jgi:hypothetical protein
VIIAQHSGLGSQGTSVQKNGQVVRRCLQLRLGHDAVHPEAGPSLVGEGLEIWTVSSSTTTPGSPVAWMTPTARPMIDTGTHTPEHRPSGRPRSFGQTPSASLLANRWT